MSTASIADPKVSPFLRTLYDKEFDREGKDESDNRILLAWNDQQPDDNEVTILTNGRKGASEPAQQRNKEAASSKAPNKARTSGESSARVNSLWDKSVDEEEVEDNKGKGYLGDPDNMGYAHSKGILGLSTRVFSDDARKGEVSMHLITHSFPRTPAGEPLEVTKEEIEKYNPIRRRFIPRDPAKFFGSNIAGSYGKAQHAFCMSFKQEVELCNGEIVFDRAKLDFNSGKQPLFTILDVLDTIGVSITLTNYVPWLKQFRIYHQLFGITDRWSSRPFDVNTRIANLNVARTPESRLTAAVRPPTHAYPLWPNMSKVAVSPNSISLLKSKKLTSLRSLESIGTMRCRRWSTMEKSASCLSSGLVLTTSRDGQPLEVQILGKHRAVIIDTDALIASRLFRKEDLQRVMAGSKEASASGPPPKKSHFIVVHQSWHSPSTLKFQEMTLIDNAEYLVKVDFLNVVELVLPVQTPRELKTWTVNKFQNHSKFFVLYPYGRDEANLYRPLAGVSDLNRNSKATQLSRGGYGRAGAFFFSDDIRFVRFFLALSPKVERVSDFSSVPLEDLIKNYRDSSRLPDSRDDFEVLCKDTLIKFKSKNMNDFEEFHTPIVTVGTSDTLVALTNLNLNELRTSTSLSRPITHLPASPPIRTDSVNYKTDLGASMARVQKNIIIKGTSSTTPSRTNSGPKKEPVTSLGALRDTADLRLPPKLPKQQSLAPQGHGDTAQTSRGESVSGQEPRKRDFSARKAEAKPATIIRSNSESSGARSQKKEKSHCSRDLTPKETLIVSDSAQTRESPRQKSTTAKEPPKKPVLKSERVNTPGASQGARPSTVSKTLDGPSTPDGTPSPASISPNPKGAGSARPKGVVEPVNADKRSKENTLHSTRVSSSAQNSTSGSNPLLSPRSGDSSPAIVKQRKSVRSTEVEITSVAKKQSIVRSHGSEGDHGTDDHNTRLPERPKPDHRSSKSMVSPMKPTRHSSPQVPPTATTIKPSIQGGERLKSQDVEKTLETRRDLSKPSRLAPKAPPLVSDESQGPKKASVGTMSQALPKKAPKPSSHGSRESSKDVKHHFRGVMREDLEDYSFKPKQLPSNAKTDVLSKPVRSPDPKKSSKPAGTTSRGQGDQTPHEPSSKKSSQSPMHGATPRGTNFRGHQAIKKPAI